MNALAALLLLITSAALLIVPRRYAALALLVGTCYIPVYVGLQLADFNFTAIRLLIAVGVIRMIVRAEAPVGALSSMDRTMLAWTAWLLLSSIFHEERPAAFVYRLGLGYDALGIYVLVRAYCQSVQDVKNICRITALVLVPLALAMLYEKMNSYNVFSILGGVGEEAMIRKLGGEVRSTGPFGHPILAGTVGGVCLPFMIGLWKTHRTRAYVGILACLTIVFCSASSGPILSALSGIFAICMWRFRNRMRTIQWTAVVTYILLDLVMQAPPYFLIARIDLAGGSTSWYRARLIQSAFEHLPEWWFAGTDNTREWMWVVVSWSTKHTDITSHYIQLGIWGGLPLMLLFLLTLWKGFADVAYVVQQESRLPPHAAFQMWTLGATLFALAVTGLSVNYFDQSFVFVYLVLGVIGSVSVSARGLAGAAANRSTLDISAAREPPYRRYI